MSHAVKKTPDQSLFIRQSPIFQSLTFDQQEWLRERMEFRRIEGKSMIYRPNDPISELYILIKGKIKSEVIHQDGKVFLKRIGLPGDIFGEHGLYKLEERNEFAWTLQDEVQLYVIQLKDLRRLMIENFDFTLQLFKIITEQIQQAEKRVVSFSVQHARWRVINFLQEMVKTQGQKIGFEWLIRHQMTQEEIGAYTGTGRQAVTETFSKFKAENIIHYSRGRILIRDLARLK